jgi:hypothetical protein
MSAMKRVHPAPFHRVAESTFNARAKALELAIPRLNDAQIALRMASIVALLHDGHSRLALGEPVFRRDRSFPFRLHRFADGIHVTATRPADSAFLGARVERIGNMPAVAAWDSVMTISAGDNFFSSTDGVSLMLTLPEIMSGLRLATSDSLVLTVTRTG